MRFKSISRPAKYCAIFAIFSIFIIIASCKKNNPTPDVSHPVVPPKTPVINTVDTSLLVGWWRWRDSLTNYRAQYFGPDGFYVRDTGVPEVGYFVIPNWWWGKNDTLFLGDRNDKTNPPGGFIVKKLTKDSLVTNENTFFRVSLPYFTSAAIKTVGGGSSLTSNSINNVNGVTFLGPGCTATDKAGNIYICDVYYHQSQLYKLAADNKSVTTVGGNLYANNLILGDSIPAKQAYLQGCNSMAVDAAGNIYLNMNEARTIRKISAVDGKIYTIYTPAQIGMEVNSIAVNTGGDIYIAAALPAVIKKISAKDGSISLVAGNGSFEYSGDGGPAIQAGVFPWSIALDNAGDLYVSDNHNSRIRKVNIKSGIISTIAGNGTSGFKGDGGAAVLAEISRPSAISIAANGDVYFCDGGLIRDAGRIRKISAASGIITSVGGNGLGGIYHDMAHGTAATMNPFGLAVDQLGNAYVSDGDRLNMALLKISAQ